MKLRSILFVLSFFFLVSCERSTSEMVRTFTEDPPLKKRVALVPLIDKTDLELPWSVREEITQGVSEVLNKTTSINCSNMPYTSQASKWSEAILMQDDELLALMDYAPYEYVVLLELLQHETLPYERGSFKPIYPSAEKSEKVIAITMRLQVFDIRGKRPRTILHEIVHSNHAIPNSIVMHTSAERPWGSDNYHFSPLGMAHARLKRDLGQRIEEYVALSTAAR